jgi:hypothetical protein
VVVVGAGGHRQVTAEDGRMLGQAALERRFAFGAVEVDQDDVVYGDGLA